MKGRRRRAAWCGLICGLGLALTTAARAHEVRAAHLQLVEIRPGQFAVLWKVPLPLGSTESGASIRPRFPAGWKAVQPIRTTRLPAAWLQQWAVECDLPESEGQTIEIRGLSSTPLNTLVSIRWADGREVSTVVRPDDPVFAIPGPESAFQIAGDYVVLGIEHILLGFDHLLFVLALLLIVPGTWSLVKTITAFTLAHSLTLSLAVLGLVRVPGPPVEAAIALSLLLLAAELARKSRTDGQPGGDGEAVRGQLGLTTRAPWLVSFSFGLLHGFGFAGALLEAGLPQSALPLALALFNAGVELGQLLFIGGSLLLVAVVRQAWPRVTLELRTVAAYAIGTLAAFWWIERVASWF